MWFTHLNATLSLFKLAYIEDQKYDDDDNGVNDKSAQ